MAKTQRREQTSVMNSTPSEREWGTTSLVNIYSKVTPGQTEGAYDLTMPINQVAEDDCGCDEDDVVEDLRKWFGKGKTGGVGGGGWDRYNTQGERIGKCGDAEDRGGDGEGKPKCLSKEKAAQLRAKGGKQAIANAVKRKKEDDPVTNRKGTGNAPRPVSNRIDEANKPTNPALWSKAKSLAKSKFDVYPSAYANGWAAKWYKEHGGSWKTVKEHIVKVDGKWRLVSKQSGKNLGTYDTKAGAEKRERQVQYFKHHEDTMASIPSFKQYMREFSGDTIEVKPPLPGEQVNEVHPPGMEDWINKNKKYFIQQYGKEKGTQVLYAKAWDEYNKGKSEAASSMDDTAS